MKRLIPVIVILLLATVLVYADDYEDGVAASEN